MKTKALILITFIISITIIILKAPKGGESIAINFKKMQYIHFDSTIDMLHPDSNFELYKKMRNPHDFRNYSEFKKNFKIKINNIHFNDAEEMLVNLTITKPDVAKIIPVFNKEKANFKEIMDKNNLPTNTFDANVVLKMHNQNWKVLFTGK